jgi:DNA uptake protein ComE-like DNA-binding protein
MSDFVFAGGASRLGPNHGYRFDGDWVGLHADLNLADADQGAAARWSLQLWASPQGFPGGLPHGVKIAELELAQQAWGNSVDGFCLALPPAGTEPQAMGLALVSECGGQAQLHDFQAYQAMQYFVQPRLQGIVTCQLHGERAIVHIDAVSNPRTVDNHSGTLALELWSMDQAYVGGAWQGIQLAGVELGSLAGGNHWADCDYDLAADGTAIDRHLVLMLREWTPAGYVTRDFRNLGRQVAELPLEMAIDSLIAFEPTTTGDVVAAAHGGAPEVSQAEPAAAVPVATTTKSALPAKASKSGKASKPAKSSAKTSAAKASTVSVNRASVDELTAVKGLTATVAKTIIAARPHASLDGLVKVKGMGPKLLEKLRTLLVL